MEAEEIQNILERKQYPIIRLIVSCIFLIIYGLFSLRVVEDPNECIAKIDDDLFPTTIPFVDREVTDDSGNI